MTEGFIDFSKSQTGRKWYGIAWSPPGGYRGGGFGGFKPPPPQISEVLTKSNRIANWAENVQCSYSNILISLKIAEFRTPTPQDVQKEGSKILKLFYISNDK